MVAATCFFLMESQSVSIHWKTSWNVGALVTLVAAVHYFYMREFWSRSTAPQSFTRHRLAHHRPLQRSTMVTRSFDQIAEQPRSRFLEPTDGVAISFWHFDHDGAARASF